MRVKLGTRKGALSLILFVAVALIFTGCSPLQQTGTEADYEDDFFNALDDSSGETEEVLNEETDGGSASDKAEESLPVRKQSLRNEFDNPALMEFKETVQNQARKFPGYFYLHAPDYRPCVALTFDDGPDGVYTPRVLDVLKDYGVPATFFLLGQNMENHPQVARRIIEEGHAVGNHSYSHPDLRKLTASEAYQNQVNKTQQVFKDILDYEPLYFRPPYGALTDEQIEMLGAEGFIIVNWSIETFDWSAALNNPAGILERVNRYHHEGAVILMHSAGGNRSTTVEALPLIIESLREKGYEFITIPEMLAK